MVCGWVGFVNIHHDYYQLVNIEVYVHVIMGTIKNECHLEFCDATHTHTLN